MIIAFSFSMQAFSQKNTLFVQFKEQGGISQKDLETFKELATFWILEKTSFSLSSKSNLVLEISLIQKTDLYFLQIALIEKPTKTTLAHGQQLFNQLTQFPQALDQVLTHQIFKENPQNLPDTHPTYDIVLALDSSGSMKEETQALKENIKDIFSSLCQNLSYGLLRFAFMDYKNPTSAYRVNLVNFSLGNEKILNRLKELRAFGKETPDLAYALYHLMRYAHFTAQNRFVFILTDKAPKNPQAIFDMLHQITQMKLQIFILMADGMSEKDQAFYFELAAKTNGKVLPIHYTLTYLLKDHSLKTFLFENFFVFEKKEKEKIDLSLGRKTSNIQGVFDFLTKEGFSLLSLKKFSLNLPSLIQDFLTLFSLKKPMAVFSYQNQEIRVAITKPEQIKALQKYYKKPLTIGGHFFPASYGLGIFSYTFKIQENPVPKLLLQNPQQIQDNPFFYFNTGLFNPPIWYVPVIFQGFL